MNKKLLLLLVVSGAQISEVKPGLFDWVSKNPAKATVYGIGVAGVAVAATYYGYAPFQKLVDDAAKATGEGLKAGVETVANSWQTAATSTKVLSGSLAGCVAWNAWLTNKLYAQNGSLTNLKDLKDFKDTVEKVKTMVEETSTHARALDQHTQSLDNVNSDFTVKMKRWTEIQDDSRISQQKLKEIVEGHSKKIKEVEQTCVDIVGKSLENNSECLLGDQQCLAALEMVDLHQTQLRGEFQRCVNTVADQDRKHVALAAQVQGYEQRLITVEKKLEIILQS